MNNSVRGIFLDFAKTFDCVNHQILLDNIGHYGVRRNAICLLRLYLTNRFQYTENSDQQIRSNELPITIGVPQGSVLGLFLFLVYINDLPNCCDSNMILYADDSVLLCADKNLEYLKKHVKMNFAKIEHWIRLNKLTLYYSKTNLVLFPGMKNNFDDNFCINTNNGPITPKRVIKYLGVFIDHKLTWKNHIQYVEEKLCTARSILSKLRYNYAPLSVLRSVYFAFGIAYRHLHYGITSWGNSASKYITKVQVQQNLILKIMTKTSFFKTRLSPIYRHLNFLKLSSTLN